MGCNDREGPCFKLAGCVLDEGHNGDCVTRKCIENVGCDKAHGEHVPACPLWQSSATAKRTSTAVSEANKALEAVDHPAHYGGKDDPHEHVKCAEAVGLDRDAMLYNATKYIWRFGKKGTPEDFLKDLKKAYWYLGRRIARLEAEGK